MKAEIKLGLPVTLWDAPEVALTIKNEIFKEPKRWQLTDISCYKFIYKTGDKDEL